MRKNSARLILLGLLSLALIRCSPVASSISKKAPPSGGGNSGEAVVSDAPSSPKKESTSQTLTALQVVVYQTRVVSDDEATSAQELLLNKGFKLVVSSSDGLKASKVDFDVGAKAPDEGITLIQTDTSSEEIAHHDWSDLETNLTQVQGSQWRVSLGSSSGSSSENEDLWKDLSTHVRKVLIFIKSN